MSSLLPTKKSTFDEHKWVAQLRKSLDDEPEEEETHILVSIFSVPAILLATDPEAYIPQQVALGPYHRFRPELYEMERYKLSAAKRIQKQVQTVKFQHLVNELTELEPRIRACYHRYLNYHSETIALMMAVDIAFLLEFLQVYADKEGRGLKRVTSRMSHLLDSSGRNSAHNTILRDIVMVENQIPLFLLRKVLEFQFSSKELATHTLNSMLMGLYKVLSPFEMMEELPSIEDDDCAHILDFLYNMIVPKSKQVSDTIVAVGHDDHGEEITEENEGEEKSFVKPSHFRLILDEVWKFLSKLNAGPISFIKKIIFAKPITLVLKMPWKIISNLPGLKLLKEPIENMFMSHVKGDEKPKNDDSNANKIPLIEEIKVPSVKELFNASVYFSSTNGGIFDISFDEKKFILNLPIVNLDVNSEVVLRNLVAYEACKASGPLVLTRYTEFMNGIIDTEEDAKFLRDRGIVFNHLKSDKEVADLWNGMSKSVKLTKVPFLDKVIEDVNRHYNRRWKVKAEKFMKAYVFGSWKFLTLLGALFLLFMTFLQAVCSVYSCARLFHLPYLEYATTPTSD